MASKKKWKKRALKELDRADTQERLADDLFKSNVKRAEELVRIDTMLHDAEFPGPTIEAYVAQVQQFLQKLVDERGIVKKSYGDDPFSMQTEAFISAPLTRPSTDDGTYDFLTEPSRL